jgi:Tol biopolymer transport system component
VRPDGHGLRQITHVDGNAERADWSPDGRRIAFELDTNDGSSVALVDADGGNLVILPPSPGAAEGDPSFIDWGPVAAPAVAPSSQ